MRVKWTYKRLELEALKYKTRGEFQKNSKGAYLSAYRKNILDAICLHMFCVRIKWTPELVRLEALKYQTRSMFQNNCASGYMFALREKFLDIICNHMPRRVDQSGENNPAFKWHIRMLQIEALKYKTYGEFYRNSPGAYQAACKRKILKQICNHMPVVSNEAYTKEELREIIKQYSTRGELAKGNPSVHVIACKRNDYDEMCSHMKISSSISTLEKNLSDTIKISYPTACRLRKTKINISNKPYIHGFDLDIFVPELMRGIEFDGSYYHSFDFMRKSRNKRLWTDNDIRNYHEIKDSYFLSEGIKVLHIKEMDWVKNKQSCIQSCLDFLSGNLCL